MRTRKPLPGYQHRLIMAAPELAAMAGISNCMIQHNGTCAVFQRRPYDCVPDITVLNGDTLLLIDEQGAVSSTRKQ